MKNTATIEVSVKVKSPIEKVWNFFTKAEHIVNWNFATDEWHCPKAESEIKRGRKFNYRMEAKDGSMGFDFTGTFISIDAPYKLEYELEDARKVWVIFKRENGHTEVVETFEAETENPIDLQQQGWQAILNNFKYYVESL